MLWRFFLHFRRQKHIDAAFFAQKHSIQHRFIFKNNGFLTIFFNERDIYFFYDSALIDLMETGKLKNRS